MNDISKRFIDACNFLIETKRERSLKSIANASSISVSLMTEVKNGRTNAGANTLQKFTANFPMISLDWLFTGRGEMLAPVIVRIREILDTLDKPYSSIAKDLNTNISEIEAFIKNSFITIDFIENFCFAYGVSKKWIETGVGPITIENDRGDKTLMRFVSYKKARLSEIERDIEYLQDEEAKATWKMSKNIDTRPDSKLYGVLTPSDEEIQESRERSIHKSRLSSEMDKIEALLENIELSKAKIDKVLGNDDLTTLLVSDNTRHTKSINLGREEFAILIPYLHDFYITTYPAKSNDPDFIDSLPRLIFRTGNQPPKEEMRAVQITDSSMDDGTSRALITGDIVVGTNWAKGNPFFDAGGISTTNLNFIIVTNASVFCRNLKSVDREKGEITYTALNNDKFTYPDLTLQMDEIVELYIIKRIERPKIPGIPSISG